MKRVYEILLHEPFGVTREEIGELTDWHAWELYIRPQVERARDKEDREDDEEEKGGSRKSRLPNREEYISTGMQFGGNRDDLGKAYDQWAASEEGQRLTNGGP